MPGFASVGRQVVHLRIGLVADDEFVLDVEHAQPVRHVVHRDLDAPVELLELDLAGDKLNGIVLEHLDRARHLADLVGIAARGNADRGIVLGELRHRVRHAAQPRQHIVHGR